MKVLPWLVAIVWAAPVRTGVTALFPRGRLRELLRKYHRLNP